MHAPVPHRHNFSLLALLTLLVAFGALSVDIAIPVLSAFAAAFQVSGSAAQLTLSVFVLGFAAAQLLAGPLSDRFGRKPVLIGGCALYVVASVACIFATSIEMLIAARFLQALGGCAGPVVGRAIVRDVYGGQRAVKILAYMASVMGVVPAISPILGGILVDAFGWRSVFVALLGFGTAALAGCLLMLKETNHWKDATAVRPRRLAGTYLSFLRDRTFLSYGAASAFTYTGILTFHSLSPFVIIDLFGVKAANFGYWFVAIVAGYASGSLVAGRLAGGPLRGDRLIVFGLTLEVIAGLTVAVLGWAEVHTPVAIIGPMAFYMFGAGFVQPNATAGAIAPHQTKAGAASALFGFTQFAVGAVLATGIALFHDGTARTLVTGVLATAIVGWLSFTLLSPRRKSAVPASGQAAAGQAAAE